MKKIKYEELIKKIPKETYSELAEISLKYTIAGYEIYLVGGCVRDLYIDIEPKDFDFTTNATVEQSKELWGENNLVCVGEKYGTIIN